MHRSRFTTALFATISVLGLAACDVDESLDPTIDQEFRTSRGLGCQGCNSPRLNDYPLDTVAMPNENHKYKLLSIRDPNGHEFAVDIAEDAFTAVVYGCGDVCVDLNGCGKCPVTRIPDITDGPIADLADNSAVVFVSCVLEYVDDLEAALRELARIAGSPENAFIVNVQPWTLTATLYPGARWRAPSPPPAATCSQSAWRRS